MKSTIYEQGGFRFLAAGDTVTCLELENLTAHKILGSTRWGIYNGGTLIFKTPAGLAYDHDAIASVLYGQAIRTPLPYTPAPQAFKSRRYDTMKYIAYGSNMSKEQMAYRCPDAKLIGTGYIKGYTLEFYLHATVDRSVNLNSRVPVAVWEINPRDERSLDYYEGFPRYYGKSTETVYMDDGTKVRGMIYLMRLIRPQPPTVDYYTGIEESYKDLGLKAKIASHLRPALRRSIVRAERLA